MADTPAQGNSCGIRWWHPGTWRAGIPGPAAQPPGRTLHTRHIRRFCNWCYPGNAHWPLLFPRELQFFLLQEALLVLAFVTTLAGTTLGNTMHSKDSLLLGGVMMNAFCAAVIMFLISMTRSFQVQHILYWLMGDLATIQKGQLSILFLVFPCFVIIFILARPMNLLLLGRETAAAMGINVKNTSSAASCYHVPDGQYYCKSIRPGGICRACYSPYFQNGAWA